MKCFANGIINPALTCGIEILLDYFNLKVLLKVLRKTPAVSSWNYRGELDHACSEGWLLSIVLQAPQAVTALWVSAPSLSSTDDSISSLTRRSSRHCMMWFSCVLRHACASTILIAFGSHRLWGPCDFSSCFVVELPLCRSRFEISLARSLRFVLHQFFCQLRSTDDLTKALVYQYSS